MGLEGATRTPPLQALARSPLPAPPIAPHEPTRCALAQWRAEILLPAEDDELPCQTCTAWRHRPSPLLFVVKGAPNSDLPAAACSPPPDRAFVHSSETRSEETGPRAVPSPVVALRPPHEPCLTSSITPELSSPDPLRPRAPVHTRSICWPPQHSSPCDQETVRSCPVQQ